jgi:hypothetical protein
MERLDGAWVVTMERLDGAWVVTTMERLDGAWVVTKMERLDGAWVVIGSSRRRSVMNHDGANRGSSLTLQTLHSSVRLFTVSLQPRVSTVTHSFAQVPKHVDLNVQYGHIIQKL